MLTGSFAALLVANVCFGYAFSSFFLLPKFLLHALGAGPRDVGWLMTVHGGVIVLVLPLLGAAVDRSGRRPFLMAGALLMAAATAGFPWVDEVGPLLFGLRMLQAVAFAMVFAAGGALAVDLAPPARLGQAIAIYGTSFLSMNAVATACSELLADRFGWSSVFAVAALGALVCAGLTLRIRESAPGPTAAGDATTLVSLALRPSTWRVVCVIALVGAALNAVFSFHQLFAFELGIRDVRRFFVAYTLAAVVVRFAFGHYIDRWGYRNVALGALALYVVVVFGVRAVEQLGLVLLGLGIGLAHGVFYPSFNAVVVAGSHAAERGKLMGVFQAAFQLGPTLGGGFFGALAAHQGYPAVFAFASGGLALAFVVLCVSPEGRRRAG